MAVEKSAHARWEAAMHKFIGVEPASKTWLIWLIFAIKFVFAPVQIIIGCIYLDSVTAEPGLPLVMIIIGVVETFWAPLFFFIYLYLPYKESNGENSVKNKTVIHTITFVLGLLSLGLFAVVVAMTALLAGVPSSVVNISCETPECVECPGAVFYGSWVWLGFKYLDLVKFGLVVAIAFKK